jgi:hypothetical protein
MYIHVWNIQFLNNLLRLRPTWHGLLGIFMFETYRAPGWLNELGSWLPNNSYKPITNTAWVRARLCKLQKWSTRLATTSENVCQLLVHGRWFSLGTPASSTTKTVRHDIAEILLKVALNTKKKLNNVIY